MKNFNEAKGQTPDFNYFIDVRKASPKAMIEILNAMNSEMKDAMTQKRFPTLDGVYERLNSSIRSLQ